MNSENNTEILSITQWDSWCNSEICKLCNSENHSITYEINWKIKDTGINKYCSEACYKCLKKIASLDPDIQNENYRNNNKKFNDMVKKYNLIT